MFYTGALLSVTARKCLTLLARLQPHQGLQILRHGFPHQAHLGRSGHDHEQRATGEYICKTTRRLFDAIPLMIKEIL
jgi:hypothetical protein